MTLSDLWRSFRWPTCCCYFVCAAYARSVSDSYVFLILLYACFWWFERIKRWWLSLSRCLRLSDIRDSSGREAVSLMHHRLRPPVTMFLPSTQSSPQPGSNHIVPTSNFCPSCMLSWRIDCRLIRRHPAVVFDTTDRSRDVPSSSINLYG